MNDEIKEILEEIKDYSEHEYLPPCCELTNEDCKILLNYITNLQQCNEKAFELLQQLHYLFGNNDSIHERIEDIQKVLKGNDDK